MRRIVYPVPESIRNRLAFRRPVTPVLAGFAADSKWAQGPASRPCAGGAGAGGEGGDGWSLGVICCGANSEQLHRVGYGATMEVAY